MTTNTFIFNQYYIDFLKRIKAVAKDNKDTSTTARSVYTSIKENYVTLDKTSDEYLLFIKEHISDEVWEKYLEDTESWFQDNKDLQIYNNIALGNIIKLLDDDYLCHHFISVFYIFKNELSEEVSSSIIKILQAIDTKDMIENLEDSNIKKVLSNLNDFRQKKIKEKAGIDMNFIEDTSLGKLAKEILEDVDVGKLQKSMQNNNDILKAIGDPDSGFADIITNVSKKMATKISNGELKQENLIQDALKFASMMPNLFGGPVGTNQGKSSKTQNSQPDLSNIMQMMSSMMGSGDENDLLKGMKNLQKHMPKGSKKSVNESALKKIAKAKKLKKKLADKKKASASSATEVVDEPSESSE
jgi:hypothetical protein